MTKSRVVFGWVRIVDFEKYGSKCIEKTKERRSFRFFQWSQKEILEKWGKVFGWKMEDLSKQGVVECGRKNMCWIQV